MTGCSGRGRPSTITRNWRPILDAELLHHGAQRLLEIVCARRSGRRSAHGVASFVDDSPHQLRARDRARPSLASPAGNLVGGDMQLHRRADKTLQQRIVQILRDARALGETFFEADVELSCDLVHAQR